jgi:hypothetical protein
MGSSSYPDGTEVTPGSCKRNRCKLLCDFQYCNLLVSCLLAPQLHFLKDHDPPKKEDSRNTPHKTIQVWEWYRIFSSVFHYRSRCVILCNSCKTQVRRASLFVTNEIFVCTCCAVPSFLFFWSTIDATNATY